MAWPGIAGEAGRGEAWRGSAWLALLAKLGEPLLSKASRGEAGEARHCVARQCDARLAKENGRRISAPSARTMEPILLSYWANVLTIRFLVKSNDYPCDKEAKHEAPDERYDEDRPTHGAACLTRDILTSSITGTLKSSSAR